MVAPSTPESLPARTRVGRTALRVRDSEAMTEFYRRVVGLTVVDRSATATTLGVGSTPLLVLARESTCETPPETADGNPHETHTPAGTGLYHNAFRVPSRRALGDALSRIRDHWQLDGAADHRVSEALYLTDPEGNGVELYCDRPQSAWPTAADGRIRMENAPLDFDGLDEATTGASRAPAGTDLGHVHLSVSRLDAFERFYVETIGFTVRATVPGAVFVAAGDYHHHVAANTWHGQANAPRDRRLSWLELVVPNRPALDSLRSRLADRDIPITETERGISATDPDGIELRFRTA